MKPEYKNRSMELLNGVDTKIGKILDMLQGVRPPDQKLAIQIAKELKLSIEKITQLVDLS